ncbi:toxin-antitoxin system HicB family antitoxin, partial [Pseudomonas aeruginosa]|uniref:type II toxin-antitoxin system HicB family antitoxin n=1 Tax=Pseudomonas aeruginosa TaxID=287 RepID=UPI000B6A0432
MNNQLKHKGYIGSIEASLEDNCLFGKILFIKALVSYEGKTVAELDTAFREAVDGYLATCKSRGQTPEKPSKGS